MYREIVTVSNEDYIIKIPKEYLNQEIEILILPFSYVKKPNSKPISSLIRLQTTSMKRTWDNSEDEAWDAL